MTFDTHPNSSDRDADLDSDRDADLDVRDAEGIEPVVRVAGMRLADVIDADGPFATLYIGPGEDLRTRAQLAIDAVPVPAPHAGRLLASVEDVHARSQAVIVSGDGQVWRFLIDDPLSTDLARFSDLPSLGPIIEAAQVTASHAVVTIEDDTYGITNFGTVDVSQITDDGETWSVVEPAILEALDPLVDELRRTHPQTIALMGRQRELDVVRTRLQRELPRVRCNLYPSDDIDRDLLATADQVVTDAATLAAERRTHELAHFRQARSASQTLEGKPALDAIEAGSARRLLVHDDLASEEPDVTRAVDRAIAAALRRHVPITMIPNVPSERGPEDGLGVIVEGHGDPVPAAAGEPVDASDIGLRV